MSHANARGASDRRNVQCKLLVVVDDRNVVGCRRCYRCVVVVAVAFVIDDVNDRRVDWQRVEQRDPVRPMSRTFELLLLLLLLKKLLMVMLLKLLSVDDFQRVEQHHSTIRFGITWLSAD